MERFEIMSFKPIGIFDSGLGGLSAAKEIINLLPNENVVYFGDTGRVPYGNRSKETIVRYAGQDAASLLSKNVKMIIAACGTVSSAANNLGSVLSVPYTGVVQPTAAAAVRATKNGKIGVIGTTATIVSSSYKKEIEKLNSNLQVFQQDCPLFVPLVENGFLSKDDPVVYMVVERYLKNLKEYGVDTLILGCTHYPLLRNVIGAVMGKNVALIDSGRETALYAAGLLKDKNLLNDSGSRGNVQFFVSDRVEGFSNIAGLFLGREIGSNV